MRRTIHDGEIRAGLSAAAKAAAVVVAVGMLAVVAGRAGYMTDGAIAASPVHALAAAPAPAPVVTAAPAPELQYPMPPKSMAAPATVDAPVATF